MLSARASGLRCLGDLNDLEEAILLQHRAAELAPHDHRTNVTKATRLNDLALVQMSRHLDQPEYIEERASALRDTPSSVRIVGDGD